MKLHTGRNGTSPYSVVIATSKKWKKAKVPCNYRFREADVPIVFGMMPPRIMDMNNDRRLDENHALLTPIKTRMMNNANHIVFYRVWCARSECE
jgi:hypothetical protein